MTAREMRYEAEIIYESIASQDAPGYTDREWSVLLTQAQENVVLDICRSGLDESEMNRRKISKLIRYRSIIPVALTNGFANSYGVSRNLDPTSQIPFLTGTAINVTNGSAVVTYTDGSGNPEPGEILLQGQPVRIVGVVYYVAADGTTAGFTLTVNYAGVNAEITNGPNILTQAGKVPYIYDFPADYLYRASGRCATANPVVNNIKLVPISRSVYDANYDNPFKKPSTDEGFWLIDDDGKHIIITDGSVPTAYHMEYVSRPRPIIIEDLDPEDAIEGYYEAMDSLLDPIVHREIVKEAAKLGYAYLKDQLGYQIQSVEQQNQ